MANSPLMPISVDLVLSIARSIQMADQKEKTISFAREHDVVLYMFQSDINRFKEFLSSQKEIELTDATAAIVGQDPCKDH